MAVANKNKAVELVKLFRKNVGLKKSVKQRLDSVVEMIAQVMGVDAVACYLVLDDNCLELFAASGFEKKNFESVSLRVGEGIIGGIAMSKRTTAVENIWLNPDFLYRAEAKEDNFKSFLGAPLIRWGRGIGVLCLYKKELYEFRKDDVEALETLAMAFADWAASDEMRKYKNSFKL